MKRKNEEKEEIVNWLYWISKKIKFKFEII